MERVIDRQIETWRVGVVRTKRGRQALTGKCEDMGRRYEDILREGGAREDREKEEDGARQNTHTHTR